MMKYPIGIQSFDKIILDGYVYVDKTRQIYNMVHTGTIKIGVSFSSATGTVEDWEAQE